MFFINLIHLLLLTVYYRDPTPTLFREPYLEIKEIDFSYKPDEHMPDYESFREEYLQEPTHPSVVETRVGCLSRAGTKPSIRTTFLLDGQHSRQRLLGEITDLLDRAEQGPTHLPVPHPHSMVNTHDSSCCARLSTSRCHQHSG